MKTYRILGKRGRITVPYEIRRKVAFKQYVVLSFEESADGRTVVIKSEIICDCNGEKSKERKDSYRRLRSNPPKRRNFRAFLQILSRRIGIRLRSPLQQII